MPEPSEITYSIGRYRRARACLSIAKRPLSHNLTSRYGAFPSLFIVCMKVGKCEGGVSGFLSRTIHSVWEHFCFLYNPAGRLASYPAVVAGNNLGEIVLLEGLLVILLCKSVVVGGSCSRSLTRPTPKLTVRVGYGKLVSPQALVFLFGCTTSRTEVTWLTPFGFPFHTSIMHGMVGSCFMVHQYYSSDFMVIHPTHPLEYVISAFEIGWSASIYFSLDVQAYH